MGLSRMLLGLIIVCGLLSIVYGVYTINTNLIPNGRPILQVGTAWHQLEYDSFRFPYDPKFSV